MRKSKIMRINLDLANELERFAKTNNIKIMDASKEFARVIRRNRGRKVSREIKF